MATFFERSRRSLVVRLRRFRPSTSMKPCELCELAPMTNWHAQFEEPFRFVIIDCDSCDVPMAVLGAHRPRPTDEESAVMRAALTEIANAKFPQGWTFDDHMRQIPDHYHLHARPLPRWWPRVERDDP